MNELRARQLFGIGIRLMGVWLILRGIETLFFAFLKLAGLPTESKLPPETDVAWFILFGMLGISLLALADTVVRICYGRGSILPPTSDKPEL
jgi:hypothetical protein